MLERETDQLIKTVRERTIGSRTGISVRDILAADIPWPLKVFFRTDVETLLEHELREQRKSSRFPYQRPDVRSLQHQMDSILTLHFEYGSEEFAARLEDGVHMVANFLVRPQWTMTGYMFEDAESVPTEEALRRFRIFGAYDYLKDLFARYASDKHIGSFTRDAFSALIWKADGEYVKRKTGDELAKVLTPLFDFFSQDRNATLPTQAIIRYFEDKGLTTVTARLEGEMAQERLTLDRIELGRVLEDVRRSEGAFQVVRDLPPAGARPADLTPPVQEGQTSPPEHTRQPESIPGNEPAPLSGMPFEDRDRQMILQKIFSGDAASFNMAVKDISGAGDWKRMSKRIDEIFIERDIDPYSSAAVRFTETFFRLYTSDNISANRKDFHVR